MNVINGAAKKCEISRFNVETCAQIAMVIITVQTIFIVFYCKQTKYYELQKFFVLFN